MSEKTLSPEKELTAEQKLQAANAELKADNKDLKGKLKDAESLVADLNKQIKALELTKGNPNPLVAHSTGNYQVVCGVRHKGVKYTAKEVAEKPELIEELIAEKIAGVLKKIG